MVNQVQEHSERPLRLLSLDGGGVRGLSTLLILEKIMISVDPAKEIRPCDYFDLIAGTSTGGIIATMLGRLKMSIRECIESYAKLSEAIFEKPKLALPGVEFGKKVLGIEQFRSDKLEEEIQKIIAKYLPQDEKAHYTTMDTVPLLEPRPNNAVKCKVFVVAAQFSDGHRCRIRNYHSPADTGRSFTILQAARATSAAPMIFDALQRNEGSIVEKFVDGGLGYNNPVQQLYVESREVWPDREIGCLLSIGTGSRKTTVVGEGLKQLAEKCAQITTDADKTAHEFREYLMHNKASLNECYFRFTVARGLEDTRLEEWKELGLIKQRTLTYLDENEKEIKQCIKALKHAPHRLTKAQQRSKNIYYNVPDIEVPDFVGRKSHINFIEGQFALPFDGPQKVILFGREAQGKTQIALEYISKYGFRYEAIFWLDASNKELLYKSFLKISKITGLDFPDSADPIMVAKSVYSFLENTDRELMLVFDGVDNLSEDYDIVAFLPKTQRARIIITGRLDDLANIGSSQEVGPMSPDDAIELLLRRTKNTEKRDSMTTEAAKIVERLGYSTATIAQAGAYISDMRIPLAYYIRIYEEDPQSVLEYFPAECDQKNQTTSPVEMVTPIPQCYGEISTIPVFQTWEIPFRKIQQKNPSAATLFIILSFLDMNHLSPEIFKTRTPEKGWDLETFDEFAQCFSDLSAKGDWAMSKVLQAFADLASLSLIQPICGDGLSMPEFSMLPMVADWIRVRIPVGKRIQIANTAVNLVWKALPDHQNPEILLRPLGLESLVFHVSACVKNIKSLNASNCPISEYGEVFAAALRGHGQYSASQELLDEVATERERTLGELHPDTLRVVGNLAVPLHLYQGSYSKAEELQLQVLEKMKKTLGTNHPDTLANMLNLAEIYCTRNKCVAAKELAIELLEIQQKVYGANDLNTLKAMGALGAIYCDLGKYKKAEELQTEALEKMKLLRTVDAEVRCGAISCLAVSYLRQKKYALAEELETEALQTKKKILRKDHPSTLKSSANLATIYGYQGYVKESQEIMMETLEKVNKTLGTDHPEVLYAATELIVAFSNQEKWEEVEELAVGLLERKKKLFGIEDPNTVKTMASLVLVYCGQKKFGAAKELQLEVIAKRSKVLGTHHPDTFNAIANLARIYLEEGLEARDTKKLESRLSIISKPKTSEHQTNSDDTLYDMAEALLVKLIETCHNNLTKDHKETLNAFALLARAYRYQKQLTPAKELGIQLLEKCRSVLGDEHPTTLTAMQDLIATYALQKSFKTVVKFGEELLETRTKLLGALHPETRRTSENLNMNKEHLAISLKYRNRILHGIRGVRYQLILASKLRTRKQSKAGKVGFS